MKYKVHLSEEEVLQLICLAEELLQKMSLSSNSDQRIVSVTLNVSDYRVTKKRVNRYQRIKISLPLPEDPIPRKILVCEKCGQYIGLQSHFCEVDPLMKCIHCDKSFTKAKRLFSHQKCHSENHYYYCHECSSKFKRKYDFVKHTKLSHTTSEYLCEICGLMYHRKDGLDRHQRIHGNKKFVCKICHKSLKYKCSLVRHIQTVHKIK